MQSERRCGPAGEGCKEGVCSSLVWQHWRLHYCDSSLYSLGQQELHSVASGDYQASSSSLIIIPTPSSS